MQPEALYVCQNHDLAALGVMVFGFFVGCIVGAMAVYLSFTLDRFHDSDKDGPDA